MDSYRVAFGTIGDLPSLEGQWVELIFCINKKRGLKYIAIKMIKVINHHGFFIYIYTVIEFHGIHWNHWNK